MNSITKLAAVALGALSIAGGVAVAQDSTTNINDGRAQTANYGTPAGAPLKRDGSLSADQAPAGTVSAPVSSDTSGSTMPSAPSTTDSSSAAPAADTALQPRADRN